MSTADTVKMYIPIEAIIGEKINDTTDNMVLPALAIKNINDNFEYIRRKIQGHINEQDLDSLFVETLRANTIITNTLIANTLYATYGDITELTVDRLESNDTRVARYWDGDTTDLNYIKIVDQTMSLVTASVVFDGETPQTTQHVDRNGTALYYNDSATAETYQEVGMSTTETAYPVTVYQYTELVKAKFSFDLIDGVYVPRITLGAGSGTGDNDKAFILKPTSKFVIEYYVPGTGARRAIEMDADGVHIIGGAVFEVDSVITGIVQVWVQADMPAAAKANDVWIDTDDYTRYDKTAISGTTTLVTSDNELITVSGTFTLTLHEATVAGIIKKIYNIGTGIVTLAGTINGVTNMLLYPSESVELITDGSGWRVL